MFDWLFSSVASLLNFYFRLTGSIGISIVLLTLSLLLLTAPLTMRSTRKMMQATRDMQRIQPKMKAIQKEFASDRQRMNEELMKLYNEEGVNPFAAVGGCLPLLLQAPIFIVMFRVLNGLGAVDANGTPDPKHLESAAELHDKIIRAGGRLVSFGVDLAQSATSNHASFLEALPFYVLVVLVGLTSWYSAKQMAGRQAKRGGAPMNQQQQMMQRIFPMIMPLISLNLPAGVVTYFVVSNIFRMGQQSLIARLDDKATTASPGTPPAPSKPGLLSRLAPPAAEPEAEPDRPASPPVREPQRPHPRSKKKKKRKKR